MAKIPLSLQKNPSHSKISFLSILFWGGVLISNLDCRDGGRLFGRRQFISLWSEILDQVRESLYRTLLPWPYRDIEYCGVMNIAKFLFPTLLKHSKESCIFTKL